MIILESFLIYMVLGFLLNRVAAVLILLKLFTRCENEGKDCQTLVAAAFQKTSKPRLRLPAPWHAIANQLYATLRWPDNLRWIFRCGRRAKEMLDSGKI